MISRFVSLSRLSLPVWLAMALTVTGQSPVPHWFGVLQPDPKHAAETAKAGVRLATLELLWNHYEPKAGQFDSSYVAQVKTKAAALRAAGLQLVLDFGLQYPPDWLFQLPHSRYINQYGDVYEEKGQSGSNGLNAVFNQAIRDRQAAYVARVFSDLDTEFFAVRLGWCYFGELQYPKTKFHQQTNCYWCYDDLAQGKSPGLPSTLPPCPVPGWKPGSPGPDHREAKRFIDWSLNSLKDYHDWQITTVRKHFAGDLAMLYPSWGLRPGQIEKAVAVDLNGTTSPERNGELQRGYDFDRLVSGIRDPKVIPYVTWLDSPTRFGNDASTNPAEWSTVHYLSHLAKTHPLRLRLWGENTGPGDLAALKLCFQRMRDYDMLGFFWAFEPDLYDNRPGHATLQEFSHLIAEEPRQ